MGVRRGLENYLDAGPDDTVVLCCACVKIPSNYRCQRMEMPYCVKVTIGENIQCEVLNLTRVRQIYWPDTLKVGILRLDETKGIPLPRNLTASSLYLDRSNGVKFSENGQYKCECLSLNGAENVILPKKLRVDRLDLIRASNITIPDGVECKQVRLNGAKNVILPKNWRVGPDGTVYKVNGSVVAGKAPKQR